MRGFLILGFICLGVLLIVFTFFTSFQSRKWFKYIIISILALFTIFVLIVVSHKFVCEGIMRYESIEDVVEKNYKDADVSYINDGSYYFLSIAEANDPYEPKHELIKYEDNKYTAYDEVMIWIQPDITKTSAYPYPWSEKTVYKIDNEVIIIIKAGWNLSFLEVYDEHGEFNKGVLDSRQHFINIVNRDDYNNDYSIFGNIGDKTYELLEYKYNTEKRIRWDEIEEN